MLLKKNLTFNILKIKHNNLSKKFLILEIFIGIKTYRYWILKKNTKSFLKVLNLVFFETKSYIYLEKFDLEIIHNFLEDLFKLCFMEVLVKNNKIYFIRLYYANKIFYFYSIDLILPFSQKNQNYYFLKFEEQNLLINFYLKVNNKALKFTKFCSATSLFLKLFLTHIYYFQSLKLKKKHSMFILKSYKGGQMFLKKNFNFQNYLYDINFQYGWNMRKNYPVYPIKFITSSFNLLKKFGFFKVKIITISKLYCSLFSSYKVGDTLILYSSELKFLIDLGLKFKFIYGLEFKKRKIFKKYLTLILGHWKINSRLDKNLKKNALVSLYGRLGMVTEKFHKTLYTYIHLSAAISSEARVHILKYLVSHNNLWFYSDTDSLFLKKPLSLKYVSTKIGFMKNIVNKYFSIKFSLFVRPRFYIIGLKHKNYLNNFFILKTSGIEKQNLIPLIFFQLGFTKLVLIIIKLNNITQFKTIIKTNHLKRLKILNYRSLKIIRYKYY